MPATLVPATLGAPTDSKIVSSKSMKSMQPKPESETAPKKSIKKKAKFPAKPALATLWARDDATMTTPQRRGDLVNACLVQSTITGFSKQSQL
jgi:hypothetical protein